MCVTPTVFEHSITHFSVEHQEFTRYATTTVLGKLLKKSMGCLVHAVHMHIDAEHMHLDASLCDTPYNQHEKLGCAN